MLNDGAWLAQRARSRNSRLCLGLCCKGTKANAEYIARCNNLCSQATGQSLGTVAATKCGDLDDIGTDDIARRCGRGRRNRR